MKHLIKNDNNITKEDITSEITRVKVLLINDKNEILVGYSYNIYQFIGGHLEADEELIDCLKREVLEEAGIKLDIDKASPFLLLEHYCNDYPEVSENRNCKIYYFAIKTNQLPDISKTKFTKEEAIGNFVCKYISMDEFDDVIISNYEKHKEAKFIGLEMLNAFHIYNDDLI